jgi:NTP pyrophosphatase (non-canonical NTP hydrolase)
MESRVNETLLILQEECAEVIQAISKCFRFGFHNFKPGEKLTNLQFLETELGDLLAMIDILLEQKIIQRDNLVIATAAKKLKLRQWSNIYKED